MEAQIHEKQGIMLADLDKRLTRIEVMLDERNRKGDEMYALMTKLDTRLSELPNSYITRREFDEFRNGLHKVSDVRYEGIKTWQAVVLGIVMLLLGVIIKF